MPALNYQERFAGLVESGKKLSTIRQRRKDGRDPKKGDVLYHYTGMRTKQCRKLGESVCRNVSTLTIRGNQLRLNGKLQDDSNKYTVAYMDGFTTQHHPWGEMREWFIQTHGLPFVGLLIEWMAIEKTAGRRPRQRISPKIKAL